MAKRLRGTSRDRRFNSSADHSSERGFSVILTAMMATVLMGMLGMAFDIGRMFITKSELQAFADASALGAVASLDGTQSGVQGANTVATNGPLGTTRPNGYNFDSTKITLVTATYAATFTGTYDSYVTASTPSTNSYRFIRVVAQAPTAMYFLSAIPGVPASVTLTSGAVAGEQPQSGGYAEGGLVPFTPDAHNVADTKNFGLVPGTQYTLKWGNGNSTTCAGDVGWNGSQTSPSAHGFVDIGQGNGTSTLRQAIEYSGYPNSSSSPSSVDAGSSLTSVPGNRGASVFSSLANRSDQDTDQVSTTWAAYKAAGLGNRRRIVTAPINDPAQFSGNGHNAAFVVVGFGNFLLDPGATISGSSGPICATYIGLADNNGYGAVGTDGTVSYKNVLYK